MPNRKQDNTNNVLRPRLFHDPFPIFFNSSMSQLKSMRDFLARAFLTDQSDNLQLSSIEFPQCFKRLHLSFCS